MADFDQGFDAFFTANKTEQKADTFDAGFSSFADQQTQDAGKLRASVGVGTKVGADQAAAQQRLASVTGLPLAVVQTNEGEAKARAKYQEISDLAKTSPVLKQRLMEPNFVALAQDDSPALSSLANGLEYIGRSAVSGLADTGAAALKLLDEINARLDTIRRL